MATDSECSDLTSAETQSGEELPNDQTVVSGAYRKGRPSPARYAEKDDNHAGYSPRREPALSDRLDAHDGHKLMTSDQAMTDRRIPGAKRTVTTSAICPSSPATVASRKPCPRRETQSMSNGQRALVGG